MMAPRSHNSFAPVAGLRTLLRGRPLASLATTLSMIAAMLASPVAAAACSVCFGADPKSPWAASINGGIYVLLGVTGVVLSWFVAVILTIRRRTKRWEARKQALHVVSFSDGAGSTREA